MLTREQEMWIAGMSDINIVTIFPYDPKCEDIFEKIKTKITKLLGEDIKVEHRGSSSLKIAGKDEIDVYIPTKLEMFDSLIPKLQVLFGEPRAFRLPSRVCFRGIEQDKLIDLFLINEEHESWIDGVKFENFLKNHPEDLEAYKKFKEAANGVSTREYYKRKTEFTNSIVDKANLENNI